MEREQQHPVLRPAVRLRGGSGVRRARARERRARARDAWRTDFGNELAAVARRRERARHVWAALREDVTRWQPGTSTARTSASSAGAEVNASFAAFEVAGARARDLATASTAVSISEPRPPYGGAITRKHSYKLTFAN